MLLLVRCLCGRRDWVRAWVGRAQELTRQQRGDGGRGRFAQPLRWAARCWRLPCRVAGSSDMAPRLLAGFLPRRLTGQHGGPVRDGRQGRRAPPARGESV